MRSSIGYGWVISCLLGLAIVSPAVAESPSSALRALSTSSPVTSGDLETRVPIPESLKGLYERGGVPRTLDQLLAMEQQTKTVARRVSDCTVNVSIGPAQAAV